MARFVWTHVWWLPLAAGLCGICVDVAREFSPSCSLSVDPDGRFQFLFASTCAAARAVEAFICGSRSTLGAAFLFYDASLRYIATHGGGWCFDHSDWSAMFNISSEKVLRLQAEVLMSMDEPSGEKLHTSIDKGGLECPGVSEFNHNAKETLASETHALGWTHEVLNVNQPYWNHIDGSSTGSLPRVACLVPIVWPRQAPFLEAIVETFGADCDELLFFISSDSAAQGELDRIARRAKQHMAIINLHVWYPSVPPDRDEFHRETGERPQHDTFNTIVKLLHMMRWAAEHRRPQAEQWWYCRLERDTFFIPENFRLLVVSERLDASIPHYLGVREFIDLPRTGFVFNDGGPGICLSQAALSDLGKVLSATPSTLVTDPDFQSCALAQGHREDLMLAACLRQANILASAATTDPLGREWFGIRPLTAFSWHHPPTSDMKGQPAWNFWTGRSHLFLPCAGQNAQWIVEFPVSFNSFKNTSMFYEAWSILSLPSVERWNRVGFVLELSGLRGGGKRRRLSCGCLLTTLLQQLMNVFSDEL